MSRSRADRVSLRNAATSRLLDQGNYFFPRHRTLVRGEHGVDDKILALHGLRDFVHQFRIIERAVVVQRQRIAGIQEAVLRKIDHVLPFGRRAAQGIQLHPIRTAADLLLPRDDFPVRRLGNLRLLQCVGLHRVRREHHPVEQGLVQIEDVDRQTKRHRLPHTAGMRPGIRGRQNRADPHARVSLARLPDHTLRVQS